MSNSDQTENQGTGSDLESLKAQADALNISYHPNIKEEKLLDKIKSHQPAAQPIPAQEILTVTEITELQQLRAEKAEREALNIVKPTESDTAKRKRITQEAGKLVRIRVSCMNPNKRDWEGEMYTVANDFVKYKRFVPFNNDEGWHVEQMMLNFMLEKECQIFYNVTDSRGNKTRKGKLIRELSIEIMTPLTHEELQELAQRQAMARGEAA